MARFRRVPRTTGGIIAGWDAIATLFGVHRMTVRRWARQHGLPVVLSPSGGALTSVGLLDLWLLSRLPRPKVNEAELAQAIAEMVGPPRASAVAIAQVHAAIDEAVQDAIERAVQAAQAARAPAATRQQDR